MFVSLIMARALRLILPDVAVHLMQRGNNRANCFRRDSDYVLYLLHLRELCARYCCAVHAYCLMTNHVHLFLTPPSAQACQTLMKQLGQRYAQHFNRTYGRTGALWEGRYHSSVATTARYVLGCYRYIELNPVDAGMVDHPARYTWSSYRANALGMDDRLVVPHAEFVALGLDATSQRHAYAALFEERLDRSLMDEIRASTRGGYPMGSDPKKQAGV
jgi:putative transposase